MTLGQSLDFFQTGCNIKQRRLAWPINGRGLESPGDLPASLEGFAN